MVTTLAMTVVLNKHGEFIKKRPQEQCQRCGGSARVPCGKCGGRGSLVKGGYQKHNPVNLGNVVDSKWTAMERTFGWRHFQVTEKRKTGSQTFVRMCATCDDTTQFWINSRNLRDRSRWSCGWLQRADCSDAGVKGTACRACGGTGWSQCPFCRV